MTKYRSSTLPLLALMLCAALIAGCQDKADNNANPAGTLKHNTMQPSSNDPVTPASTPVPGAQ